MVMKMVNVITHEEMQEAWNCIDIFRSLLFRMVEKIDAMDDETKKDLDDVVDAMGEWY